MSIALAAALSACDGGSIGGEDAGMADSSTTPRRDAGMQPTGDASLSFSPTWGNAQAQFQGQNWQSFIDLSIFQPSRQELRDTRVVIMLCAVGDTSCESPIVLREVAPDETDGDPIQSNFGPDIAMRGLPAGEYELMVFADTGLSRSRGFGWDDVFDTEETAWGGVVSELDVMMSTEPAAPGFTPPPATVRVTLTDSETTDLGTIRLQHVHERNISSAPTPENGVMAVAVADGLRLIDLQTHSVLEIAEGSGYYTHQMVNASGSPFAGTVCGMIRGPGETVFLMYTDPGVGAGFAVQYDVGARSQMHGGSRILFPDEGMPCRGRYHEVGGNGYLYVTNASASRTLTAAADENLWVAAVGGLATGNVTATLLDRGSDPLLQHGVDDIAADGSTLYLSIVGANADGGLPAECTTSYCVFTATIGSDGLPVLNDGSGYEHIVGPEIGESYPTPMGAVTCIEEASAWAPIEVAELHDGRRLLFLGACLEVAVFDTSDGTELDLNPAPGVQGIDGTVFGYAFNELALSPDGRTLWALPQMDSPIHFNFRRGIDEPEARSTGDRQMALPIDLSQGSAPALHPDYTGDDIDGYEGPVGGGYRAPAADPGVDIKHAWYAAYMRRWINDAPSFQPASGASGPSLAVTSHALWMRGAGNAAAGASGLGKSGNLAVFDLAARRAVLFPYDDTGYYRFWHGGAEGRPIMGFDLTPENDNVMATFGLEYFPAP